ncbi:hypothetical protein K502DRAFT_341639 [Neoconidiobolus thromboides FSU 785]|nr:hypothetical protein K502DRAFT_341639 [Neoconidiobolus thromboides FSU 785]
MSQKEVQDMINNDLSELLKDSNLEHNELNIEGYNDLNSLLKEQSHNSQNAIEELELIENQDLFNDNTQASLNKLTDHLSSAFKQVDQLEDLINFVDKKANALDSRINALELEQNEWLKNNKS